MKKVLSVFLVVAMLLSMTACDGSSTSSDPEVMPSNVALNKRVYCSSEAKSSSMTANQATDGDEDTSWSSNTTQQHIDEWVMVDLGKNYDIDSITLKWGTSRAVDYSIEISRGGVEFEEIHTAQDVTSTDDETIAADNVARYLRIRCKKVPSVLMTFMGATIRELEVIGTISNDQTLGSEKEEMKITKIVVPTEDDVLCGGRTYSYNKLVWAGATYEYQCTGTVAGAVITGESGYFEASVDGGEYQVFEIQNGSSEYIFSNELSEGTHTVRILRRSDPWRPPFTVDGVVVEETSDIVKGYKGNYDLKIEFIGDSITSATGIYYHQCYTTKTAEILNAHFQVVSRAGMGLYRNAGNGTGDTLPEQYQWTEYRGKPDKCYNYKADVVVLNIGTNDGMSLNEHVKDPAEKLQFAAAFEKLYYEMLDEILVANPGATIVCVYGQLGKNSQIEGAIINAVKQYKKDHSEVNISYLPFEYAYDVTEETQWHPGAGSHARDAKLLAAMIKKMLTK